MRNRLLLVAMLLVPTYASAQDLQCGNVTGGFWPFGSLTTWCVAIRSALCTLKY
jgi:hypothetical protein